MHLPSRGLRLSATTMRNTGVFFAPIRFMRIFTDIKSYFSRGGGFATVAVFLSTRLFCRPPTSTGGARKEWRAYSDPPPLARPVLQFFDGRELPCAANAGSRWRGAPGAGGPWPPVPVRYLQRGSKTA